MHAEGHKHTNTQHPHRCDLANVWAARTLITPTALVAAAHAHTGLAQVARALAVTPEDLDAYLGALSARDFRAMRTLVGHALV